MNDFLISISKNVVVFLVKEDHHFTQELKERIYRYDEQLRGERK